MIRLPNAEEKTYPSEFLRKGGKGIALRFHSVARNKNTRARNRP